MRERIHAGEKNLTHVAFVKNMILILQASLVTKTRGHHHNCFDSQRDRVLKILTQVRLYFAQDR